METATETSLPQMTSTFTMSQDPGPSDTVLSPPVPLNSTSAESKDKSQKECENMPLPSLDLRSSKTWDPIFLKRRKVEDRPFVDTVSKVTPKLGLLTAFLQSTNASGTSWEVQQVQRFCKKTPGVPNTYIWVDDRVNTAKTKNKALKWVTPSDLDKVSRLKVRPVPLDRI